MRPFFQKQSLWVYPLFGGIGGAFGYWLMGVEQSQMKVLADRRDTILAKRARREQREGVVPKTGDQEGIMATQEAPRRTRLGNLQE